MSDPTARVRIQLHGVPQAPPGGEVTVQVPTDLGKAVQRVKEVIAERNVTIPYSLFLNGSFVPDLVRQVDSPPVRDGDEFTVIPVFSGG